jgi:large subunit ribosomal protein L24
LVSGVNYKFKSTTDEEYVQRKKTVQSEYPVHISNCQLVDPSLNKPTKITWGYLEDGSRVRVSKKSGAIIEKPVRDDLTYIARTKKRENGPHDTLPEEALKKTYKGEDFSRVKAEFDEYIRIKEEKERAMWFAR